MSVDVFVEKVFDGFKKITPALIAVAIFTGLILFLPVDVLKYMALDHLPDLWKTIIGLIFLLCLALTLTTGVASLFNAISSAKKRNAFLKNKKKQLANLSPEQKSILATLLKSQDKRIKLNSTSGNTVYLLSNHFINQPQQMASLEYDNDMWFYYIPESWLLSLYNEKPDILE